MKVYLAYQWEPTVSFLANPVPKSFKGEKEVSFVTKIKRPSIIVISIIEVSTFKPSVSSLSQIKIKIIINSKNNRRQE